MLSLIIKQMTSKAIKRQSGTLNVYCQVKESNWKVYNLPVDDKVSSTIHVDDIWERTNEVDSKKVEFLMGYGNISGQLLVIKFTFRRPCPTRQI